MTNSTFGGSSLVTKIESVLDIRSFHDNVFWLGEKMMNFPIMISAIGQKQLGPGDAWGNLLYISFVVISSFDESLTETPKKTGERQTSQRSNSDKSSF